MSSKIVQLRQAKKYRNATSGQKDAAVTMPTGSGSI